MANVREPLDPPKVAVTEEAAVEPPSPPEPVRPVEQTSTPAPADLRESPPDRPQSVASTAPGVTSAPRQQRITYWVQAGAFRDVERASQLESSLLALRLSVSMRPTEVSSGRGRVPLTRVQVGPFSSQSAALAVLADLRKRGYTTFVTVDRD